MKPERKRSMALVGAICLLCGVMLVGPAAGPPGWSQPGPGGGEMVSPDMLHHQLTQQLVGAWAEIAQRVEQDPRFLESPEAEPLLRRAETLKMIHREVLAAFRPGEPGPGPESNGRFQFVEWINEGEAYWVLDTRTGEMHPRHAPPREE